MNRVKAVLIGAGQRGKDAYATYAHGHPGDICFVGVCEPNEQRREIFCKEHGIPEDMSFASWEDFFARSYDIDAVLICTQDHMHFAPASQALEKGYHVLLEKPMSNTPEECVALGELAQHSGKIFSICHVLRYTPFFVTLKKLLDSGEIGQLISISHNENVAYWHQAHSFVRGNWRNSESSSPMIVAKSCHDMDILLWLAGADCLRISSFGMLSHFKEEQAPKGSPQYCLDGCPAQDECLYYAPHMYIEKKDTWQGKVFRSVVTEDAERDDAVLEALRSGPYGRCVYHCDNNVVDHQVVNLEFANEVTASFSMTAFTNECTRTLKLMGTKGEIRGAMEKNEIEITRFGSGTKETICFDQSAHGHNGGDHGIMRDFVKQVREHGTYESRTSASQSVQGHLIAFAAEKSRVENEVITLSQYKNSVVINAQSLLTEMERD